MLHPLLLTLLCLLLNSVATAGTTTWDGKFDTSRIQVKVVYFVPADRTALPDWRERVDYYCRRIEQFHEREFGEQSTMHTTVHPTPLVSNETTQQLRKGDGDAIFFRTLRECDERLEFARKSIDEREAFPILLVLSEINWRPLDDFYRLHPQDGELVFEGNYHEQQHFPGATSGGARATYLSNRGVGWGLVSADGWRVPYRGSDCVVYHEGCGHTVGLPHPEPGNGSVMSLGQYRGWISESWLDKDQKVRMQWEPRNPPASKQQTLFSEFRAIPNPKVPGINEPVRLSMDWPDELELKSLRVRFQTDIGSPWIEVPQIWEKDAPKELLLGTFDRATPISYRVDVESTTGETAELWGYLQVRADPEVNPLPLTRSSDLLQHPDVDAATSIINQFPQPGTDLLSEIDLEQHWQFGEWKRDEEQLVSPKMFGARLELPAAPQHPYRLTLIVEPLDVPNGLILGQRMGEQRFVSLFNYRQRDVGLSAIENIQGKNVGNDTTFAGNLFRQNQLSQVIVTVRDGQVLMQVDGHTIVNWQGSPADLSLSDYWKTPNKNSLFIGTYDCRYRFHRITLQPLATN